MSYRRIDPFPEEAARLGSSELEALGRVWREKKEALQETDVFQGFLTKLQREWAIETGIIERLYTWDRGVTEVLIEQGIDATLIAHQGGIRRHEADHVKALIDDQLAIIEGLFSYVKGKQPLTEHFIRGLQAQFTSHQDATEALTTGGDVIRVPLEKGAYKTLPNNPRRPDGEIHAYCPGDLKPLVAMFARRQKESILQALGLEQQVQQDRHTDRIIHSALEVLKDRQARAHERVGRVYDYADELVAIAETRMRELAQSLDIRLCELTPPNQNPYGADWNSARNDSAKKHYLYNQILELAQTFHYFANLERYRAWIRITIETQEHFEFIVSIHGYGHGDTGVMAASALMGRRIEKEEGGTEPVGVQSASVDLFQFNYAESPESTTERFRDWLESALAIALGEWKRLIAA